MKKDLKLKCQPPAVLFKYLLVGFLMLVAPVFSQAQTKTVTGVVTDGSKMALPGVTVLVKGTKTSTTTNFDGAYKINVSTADALLVFSYIGFENKQISVGSSSQINATLKESIAELKDVIVVGYGTQKKANLTGAVSTVTAKSIEDRPITSLATALQGTAPGLNITRNSGQPGSENISIQVRGATSANGGVNPLLLVDGVATSLFTLQTINPSDVETITVLKDGAAAAIYGAQAAGGVILVTTKKGKEGKTRFEYTTQLTVQQALHTPERLSLWEEANYSNLAKLNAGIGAEYTAADLANIQNGVAYIPDPANSEKYIYYNQENTVDQVVKQASLLKTHNLSASGGTEKTNYLFSLGYLDQDGIFKVGPDHFSRFNLRLNVGAQLTKHITLDSKIAYAKHDRDAPAVGSGEVLYELYRARSRFPIFTPEGRLNGMAATSGANSYAYLTQGGYDKTSIDDLDGNFALTAKDFVKGLSFKAIYGRKLRSDDSETFSRTIELWGITKPFFYLNNPNTFNLNQGVLNTENFQFLTDYDLTLAENHKFHFLAGYQWEDYRFSSLSAGAKALKSNDLPTLNIGDELTRTNSQSIQTYANQSYFGRINYSYKNKYLLEATLRSDESSRLAPGLRVKTFPSASAGWNVHKEDWFANNVSFVSDFKLRASWGQLGNAQGIGFYDYLNVLASGTSLALGSPETKTAYYWQNTTASSNLSWETVETFNYGLDFGFFNNKLQGSFDYYTKENKNMLTPLTLPATFGIGTPRINNGVLKTWGWELAVNYRNRVGKDFSYGLGFNLSDSDNKLVSYAGRSTITSGSNGIIEGYPLATLWGYKTAPGYISSAEQLAATPVQSTRAGIGDIAYIDQNGDGKINAGAGTPADHGDLVQIGSNQQRYLFGATAEATWKNIDFNIFFQGVGKREIMPSSDVITPYAASWLSPMAFHRDYWTPENPNAAFPRPYQGGSHNTIPSDRWILNAAYVRLKNVQLGYTLPKSVLDKVSLSKVRFFISAQDVFTVSKLGIFKTVYDPEQRNGVDYDYPLSSAVSLGLNLSF